MKTQYRVGDSILNSLSKIAKILYEDDAYVILNYIMSSKEQIGENVISNKLNLPFNVVRKNLNMLEKHGILQHYEHKKHNEDSDISTNNNNNFHPKNQKKSSTYIWKLNNTFYNVLQKRFENLKKRIHDKINQREKKYYECGKCHRIFAIESIVFNHYECPQCIDHQKLIQKGGEDLTELRKKINELITDLDDIFSKNSGETFIKVTTNYSHDKTDKKMSLMNDVVCGNFEVIFDKGDNGEDPFEDPIVYDCLKEIKRDEKKNKVFCDIVEYYSSHK